MKESDIEKFKNEMRQIWKLGNKDSLKEMVEKEKKIIDELIKTTKSN